MASRWIAFQDDGLEFTYRSKDGPIVYCRIWKDYDFTIEWWSYVVFPQNGQ